MKEATIKTAKDTGVKVLIALVAAVGLRKATEMLAAKGGMTEKIAAIGTLLVGAGLQFTKSDIAKTIGIVAMAEGGVDTVKALITDNTGMVRSNKVASTLAKAVMPNGGDLAGYQGMGSLMLAEQPAMVRTSGLSVSNLVGQ